MRRLWVHCSASTWGNAAIIDSWHKARGWRSSASQVHIGYHYVILNGRLPGASYAPILDGSLEAGRSIEHSGAHTKGFNHDVGVCLIGLHEFTACQLQSLRRLASYLVVDGIIERDNVHGHCEAGSLDGRYAVQKTCPNMPMDWVRKYVGGSIPTATMLKKIKEYNES